MPPTVTYKVTGMSAGFNSRDRSWHCTLTLQSDPDPSPADLPFTVNVDQETWTRVRCGDRVVVSVERVPDSWGNVFTNNQQERVG